MHGRFPRQVVLVRHGESAMNVARAKSPGFFTSEADREAFLNTPDYKVPLTERGIKQAIETGRALRSLNYHFDVAFDTGYRRTEQTLDHILEAYTVDSKCTIRRRRCVSLREREPGYTYCMTREEAHDHFPWLQSYWKMAGHVFARPVGGESLLNLADRVGVQLPPIYYETAGERVLMCLHGRVIAAIRFIYEGWSIEQYEEFIRNTDNEPSNCGVTVYNYSETEQRFVLNEYNTRHW